MAEISLTKAIPFDKGYVLQAAVSLAQGALYYLRIQDGANSYDRTYIPAYNNNTILDAWGAVVIQALNNVCFTLTDVPPCVEPACTIVINGA